MNGFIVYSQGVTTFDSAGRSLRQRRGSEEGRTARRHQSAEDEGSPVAAVRKGSFATLAYRVDDPVPRGVARPPAEIEIRRSSGLVVKTLRLGIRPTNQL